MKPILGALILVPLMEAFALAQAPVADAKEGKFYLEGGVAFGVATEAAPASNSKGIDSIPLFGAGFAAEYGINEQWGVFTRLGGAVGISDDPSILSFGMVFDAAYKVIEKKGDVPAVSIYGGLGFVLNDIDPKGPVTSDSATDFVIEFGIQADIPIGDMSLQPFAQV